MHARVPLLSAVVFLTACSAPPPPEPATRTARGAATSGAAAAKSPPPRTAFEIGEVSPAELAVSGSRLAPQILSVSYAIPEPSTVVTAELRLYVSELGDLVTRTVDPMERGVLHFPVEPREHSLGTHVRFRAHCPAGVTEWHSLGQMPLDYQARMADVFRISAVTPQSIPWSPAMDPNQSAAGTRVSVFGPKIGADCRLEAQANGTPIELHNVHYYDRAFAGLILNRDLGYSSVSPRYAELKLVITRASGHRIQAVKRVPFSG